jgi:hypothetical protein
VLLKKQCEKRVTESAQAAKNAELEVLTKSQAEKITELETAYTDLQRERDNVTGGYQRLAVKHNAFMEKVKQDKMKVAETQATELAKLHVDLDLEACNYIEYRQTVHCQLRELHEMVALPFGEVKVQCLPFLDKGAKVEEMIDWVAREVKDVSDTVWRLNDNFSILGIDGIHNMLNGERCQELNQLCDLATSGDVAVLEDVPENVHRLAGQIVQRWWKPHGLSKALCWHEAAHTVTASDSDDEKLMFCIVN